MRRETNIARILLAIQTQRVMRVNLVPAMAAVIAASLVLPVWGESRAQKPPGNANPSLQISHRARAVAPGEVIIVDVRATEPIDHVRAQWLSQTVLFYQVEPRWWQGLAPVDVGAAPGAKTMNVVARLTAGRTLERPYAIAVAARTFPARRITVAPKFADPPADELPRIEAERKAVEAIFASQAPERFWRQPFIVPVPGASTSSFGRRTILNGQTRGQHTGTDFQAATGTPVVAPNRGRVALAADHYFPGRTIIIDHGLGVYSYLAHLSEFSVAEGAVVERGQRIALSGATGRVTGPHLHWTMRMGRARVDPLSLVAVLD
jgi:murein DD-endopeptidase MepM/ murein hydrolase activator NlpD